MTCTRVPDYFFHFVTHRLDSTGLTLCQTESDLVNKCRQARIHGLTPKESRSWLATACEMNSRQISDSTCDE
jgi:hypothetical protein